MKDEVSIDPVTTDGAQKILLERQYQLDVMGYKPVGDYLGYDKGILPWVASLLVANTDDDFSRSYIKRLKPSNWEYERWMAMFQKPYHERLVIAGALIAAEIDRDALEQRTKLDENGSK